MSSYSKHLSSEKRQALIIETVISLAATQNPNGITTTAIAQHMGVTQGALFKHFSTKNSMLQAVTAWIAEQLFSRIEAAEEKASSPLEAIEAIFNAHIQFVTQHPGVPRILFGELQRTEDALLECNIRPMMKQYKKLLFNLIEKGKNSGDFDEQLDTEAALIQFIGTIQGLVVQSLFSDNADHIHKNSTRVFDIYLRGIRSSS